MNRDLRSEVRGGGAAEMEIRSEADIERRHTALIHEIRRLISTRRKWVSMPGLLDEMERLRTLPAMREAVQRGLGTARS